MEPAKYPYIAKRLIDYIEERISSGQFPPGYKVQSLRTLSSQFELDIGAVRRAMDYLADIGLIEKRPGSGNYVGKPATRRANAKMQKVAMLLGGENTGLGIYSTVLLGIQKSAADIDIQLLHSFNFKSIPIERANAQIDECGGAILLGGDEYGDKYKSLTRRVPIVAVCASDSCDGAVSIVDIDPFDSAMQSMSFFKSRSVSKVFVVSHSARCFYNRGLLFSAFWNGEGGKFEHVDSESVSHSFQKGAGYLFTTGSIMQRWCDIYREKTGRRLAEDFPILGIDGKNRIDPAFDKAPTISIDWQLAGKYALEECIYRMKTPGASPRRIYLPGQLFA